MLLVIAHAVPKTINCYISVIRNISGCHYLGYIGFSLRKQHLSLNVDGNAIKRLTLCQISNGNEILCEFIEFKGMYNWNFYVAQYKW